MPTNRSRIEIQNDLAASAPTLGEFQCLMNLSASLPKVLYSIKSLKNKSFSWSPDGRLMVILEGENERVNRIDLIVNFEEEIRGKMATAK